MDESRAGIEAEPEEPDLPRRALESDGITLEGGHFVSRMGASFMTAAGMPEWVAENDTDYVARAVSLSHDRGRLLDLKRGLRDQLRARPGWDPDRYAAEFGRALKKMWRETMADNEVASEILKRS